MAITFTPLADLLGEKNLTWYDLHQLGVSHRAINRLKRNRSVSTKVIAQVCDILQCKPGDIMRRIGDDDGYVDVTDPSAVSKSYTKHAYAFVSFVNQMAMHAGITTMNAIYVSDAPYARLCAYTEGLIKFDTVDDGQHIFPAAAIKMIKIRKFTESEFKSYCNDNKIYDTHCYHLK